MSRKQFIILLTIASVLSIVYLYDTIDPILSRSKCADYAMVTVVGALGDNFALPNEKATRQIINPEAAQQAKATYDLYYDFCINKRGSE